MLNLLDNRGLIRTIILVVIALLILSYFGFNLREIATSPTSKANFTYVKEVVSNIWNNYLRKPAEYVFDLFLKLVWQPAMHQLNRYGDTASSTPPIIPIYTPR